MRSCCRWLGAAGWLTDNNNNNESNECVTVPEGRVIYSMYYDYSDAPARAASQRECLTAAWNWEYLLVGPYTHFRAPRRIELHSLGSEPDD